MTSSKMCQVKKDTNKKKYRNLVWPYIAACQGSMTQLEFSKKVGWHSRSYLSIFKTGKVIPSDATLIQMASAMNMSRQDVSEMMRAVAQDRIDRKQDIADEKARLEADFERTRTQQTTQIDTVSGDPCQISQINTGGKMIEEQGEPICRDEWAILLALTRLGISRETRGLIVDELEALQRNNSGRTSQNIKPAKKLIVNDAK